MDRRFPDITFYPVILPLLLLSSFTVLAVIFLVSSWNIGQSGLGQQLVRFDKTRSIATYGSKLKAAASTAPEGLESKFFYANGPDAIISAQVAANFKQMAAKHGLEIIRAGDLPAIADGPIKLVGETFDLSGSIANVYALIQEVEDVKPFLFVDKMDIHANGNGANDLNVDTALNITIQLYAAIGTGAIEPTKVTQ
jgi:Type II secretion system (T2SS), protein M subtype b